MWGKEVVEKEVMIVEHLYDSRESSFLGSTEVREGIDGE